MSDHIIDLTPINRVITLPDPRDNKWNDGNTTVMTKSQFNQLDPDLQKQVSEALNKL